LFNLLRRRRKQIADRDGVPPYVVFGDASLASSLHEWMSSQVKGRPAFLRHMAEAALQARPGLNRFGGFATEETPNARGTINLKLHGARIFVDAARIYALALGLPHTNTAERLRAARASLGMSESETAALTESFFLIQRLRLQSEISASGSVRTCTSGCRTTKAQSGSATQASISESVETLSGTVGSSSGSTLRVNPRVSAMTKGRSARS